MLLQSLLLIATLTVLGGALLGSTLVTAKSAFHAKVMRAGENAMNDATADFVSWAQRNVRDNGIDQLSVWSSDAQTIPPAPACHDATVTDVAASVGDACKMYETIRWNVTGYTGSAASFRVAATSDSLATGLSSSQNEQRMSFTITVAITDPTQKVLYATHSRELTARIFHSAPYVAVTGERDAASEVGSISSAEGDTAGYAPGRRDQSASLEAPDASVPAGFANTTITTTEDCVNTADNASRDALADDSNIIYKPLRPYGNLAWIYEVPCKPLQLVDPATAPAGYAPPADNVYRSQGVNNANWSKNDEDNSSFAW